MVIVSTRTSLGQAGRPMSSVGLGVLLALALLAEVLMLVGLAVGGWSMVDPVAGSIVLSLLLPAAVVLIWGTWCAPRASHRLPRLHRWMVKTTLFSATFLLLLLVAPGPAWSLVGLGMWLAFIVSLPVDQDR